MQEQDAHVNICKHLQLPGAENLDLKAWRTQLAERWDNLKETVSIAMVGKYTELSDAYLSVLKVGGVVGMVVFWGDGGICVTRHNLCSTDGIIPLLCL